ncbi:MAG: pseudouridine synthase [Rhodospirillales bacterium]
MSEKNGERIAKRIARAGLASRREAEKWISDGRVVVNGHKIDSPALNVTETDIVVVDGKPLGAPERVRLWRYHKPAGLVTTNKDPEGRSTIFEKLPRELPRVITVGRLDINSEGLLLLTNDGDLARRLELPSNNWLRRYRVRANGRTTPEMLAGLVNGVTVEGVRYGPVIASLDMEKGANTWMTVAIREGKNREVRKLMDHIGMTVNRLIRVSYGPFQLGTLVRSGVEEVPPRVMRDQLGAETAPPPKRHGHK